MAKGLNKHLHGTVWRWTDEFVLIISSDEYNSGSLDVNCISIAADTGFDDINCFLCNQIHTAKKEELSSYEGAVPALTLAAIKTKIQKQLNLGNGLGNLQPVLDTATKLVGQLVQMDSTSVPSVVPAAENVDKVPHVEETKEEPKEEQREEPRETHTRKPKEDKKKPDRQRREYSDADVAFILDGNHTVEEIMARYGFKKRVDVSRIKTYLKARRKKRNS